MVEWSRCRVMIGRERPREKYIWRHRTRLDGRGNEFPNSSPGSMPKGQSWQAARSVKGDRPVLAIRGISDIVGYRRDADWTKYACHSAASFTKAFITSSLL